MHGWTRDWAQRGGRRVVRFGEGFESAVQSELVSHVSHVYHSQLRPLTVEVMLDSLP
jgi:hypothetical protein